MIPLAKAQQSGYDEFTAQVDAMYAKYGKGNLLMAFSLLSNTEGWDRVFEKPVVDACNSFCSNISISRDYKRYFINLSSYLDFTYWLYEHKERISSITARSLRRGAKYNFTTTTLQTRTVNPFTVTDAPGAAVARWFNSGKNSVSSQNFYCVSKEDIPKVVATYGSLVTVIPSSTFVVPIAKTERKPVQRAEKIYPYKVLYSNMESIGGTPEVKEAYATPLPPCKLVVLDYSTNRRAPSWVDHYTLLKYPGPITVVGMLRPNEVKSKRFENWTANAEVIRNPDYLYRIPGIDLYWEQNAPLLKELSVVASIVRAHLTPPKGVYIESLSNYDYIRWILRDPTIQLYRTLVSKEAMRFMLRLLLDTRGIQSYTTTLNELLTPDASHPRVVVTGRALANKLHTELDKNDAPLRLLHEEYRYFLKEWMLTSPVFIEAARTFFNTKKEIL